MLLIKQCSHSTKQARAQGVDKAPRKKLSLKVIKVKLMTYSRKILRETRATENILTQNPQAKHRLATVNVCTLVGRSAEVTEIIGRRQVDIIALQ